jgi:glycosyltransferase involved in cell wall biosynthesis
VSSDELVCIIIPCFNEDGRLNFEQILKTADGCHLLFVNDGSTDRTLELINSHQGPKVHVLDLKKNGGKAEAVRQGALYLKQLPFFSQLGWFGYWDADLSTPLTEVKTMLKYHQTFYPDSEAIFGSRFNRLGSRILRSPLRHLLGRAFMTVINVSFSGLGVYDSQCGAKLLRREVLDLAFGEPFLSDWIFDVEVLLRLRRAGRQVIECPVQEWHEVLGSKMNVIRYLFKVPFDIWKIRKKYLV